MTALVDSPRSSAAGVGRLVRLAVRRDRVLVVIWYAVLLAVCYASAASTASLYPTEADRVKAAETINAGAGIVALYGPILDVHSTGELAMTKMTVLYSVFAAIMLLFVVRRHTRLDEENGQAELLSGTAITRGGLLAAAVAVGFGLSLALGALAAAVDVAGGLPVGGSVAFGASWAGTGLVATGLTAAACQLSASARTCAAVASGALGVLFLLRAVGDTTSATWLSWLTPFGWNTRLRAYGDPRWWLLVLYVVLALVLVGVAGLLSDRRDLGSGLLALRPGPATGSPRLRDVLGLAVRVHAPMLVGWTLAVGVLGVVFGAITPSFNGFDSAGIQKMLGQLGGTGAFSDSLLGAIISVVAIVITCFTVTVVGHAASDEHDGRTEQVLATATSRARAFAATLVVGVLGATWLLVVLGVSLAVGIGGGRGHSFGRLVASAVAQAPAVWAVAALAVLCFALASRWAAVGWGVLVLFVTLGQLGELVGLPRWVLDLSPYSHAPRMPLADFELGPALVLTVVSVAVLVVSWLRYRTRDIG